MSGVSTGWTVARSAAVRVNFFGLNTLIGRAAARSASSGGRINSGKGGGTTARSATRAASATSNLMYPSNVFASFALVQTTCHSRLCDENSSRWAAGSRSAALTGGWFDPCQLPLDSQNADPSRTATLMW